MIYLSQHIRHMLGRMPRCVACRDDNRAELKSVAILDSFGRNRTRAALAAGVNLCRFHPRAQLARAAHQIGMNVRLENVRDEDVGARDAST